MLGRNTVVGIIANPFSGKDIRRLVAHGRVVSDLEKVNSLRRILAGLVSLGTPRVVFMPDSAKLGEKALNTIDFRVQSEFLDMSLQNNENDSMLAAKLMDELDVGCLITLGGDGTNRVVAKRCGDTPLLPISTGTNNVFPLMIEPTVAGIAAGAVAGSLVKRDVVISTTKRLEVFVDGELVDIALVDVARSKERYIGARAVWDIQTIQEICLTHSNPASIGLSAIGTQLDLISADDPIGIRFALGESDYSVLAPVAPGMVVEVPINHWSYLTMGGKVEFGTGPCTIALDGERSLTIRPGEKIEISLTCKGPRVVRVDAVLKEMALNGTLRRRTTSNFN